MGINSVVKEKQKEAQEWKFPCLLECKSPHGNYVVLAKSLNGRGVVVFSTFPAMGVGYSGAGFTWNLREDYHLWSLYQGEIVLSNS